MNWSFSFFLSFHSHFSPLFNCSDFWEIISMLSSNSQLNFLLQSYICKFHDRFLKFTLVFSFLIFHNIFSYRHNISLSLNCIYIKVNLSHYLLLIGCLKGNFNGSISIQRYCLYKASTPQLTRLIQAEQRMLDMGINSI